MDTKDISFSDISIGDSASFERMVIENDVMTFAQLSGDTNPLHFDGAYAKKTKFGQPIVHGMFIGSLFSALVGMYLPGKRCLYLGQTLQFRKPVFINDTVVVHGSVVEKSESTHILTINTTVTRGEDVVVSGIATVQVLS